MRFCLGLDGGGTGCRAVLAEMSGQIIGRGEGGPCNVMSDPEGALKALLGCAEAAMGDVDPAEISAVLGLAGANMAQARDWLGPRLPFGRAQVVHDAITAVIGAIGHEDGIVAAMGTGSVFMRQLDGQLSTVGGWGPILGDEGSGNWLGRRYLAGVLRALDGIGPRGRLVDETLSRHGGAAGIVAFARAATAAGFAAEVPHLLAVPDDPLTLEVFEAARRVVARSINALQPDEPLAVTFTGGLGQVYSGLLGDRFQIRPPEGSALDGALRMALEWAQ